MSEEKRLKKGRVRKLRKQKVLRDITKRWQDWDKKGACGNQSRCPSESVRGLIAPTHNALFTAGRCCRKSDIRATSAEQPALAARDMLGMNGKPLVASARSKE